MCVYSHDKFVTGRSCVVPDMWWYVAPNGHYTQDEFPLPLKAINEADAKMEWIVIISSNG
ncbi:MAG: hypothetical protein ACUX7D_04230 [Candidatus Methanodesulfokora washburnensis]